MKKIIIFDTNAYRNFVDGKSMTEIKKEICEIKAKEQNEGYIAFMGTTVGQELLSHMKDDCESRSFKSCIKAVQAIYWHCGDSNEFRLVPLPETQLAKEFFNVENKKSLNVQQVVGQVLYQIANNPTSDTIKKYDSELQQIIDFINDAEKTLAGCIEQLMKNIDSSYSDWTLFKDDEKNRKKWIEFVRSYNFKLLTALAMLVALCYDLEGQGIAIKLVGIDEQKKQAENYISRYAAPFELRKYWMEKLLGHFDLTKQSRSNFIWDERILHQAGKTINNIPILIVTSDGAMKECAERVNPQNEIITYNDYIQQLG